MTDTHIALGLKICAWSK